MPYDPGFFAQGCGPRWVGIGCGGCGRWNPHNDLFKITSPFNSIELKAVGVNQFSMDIKLSTDPRQVAVLARDGLLVPFDTNTEQFVKNQLGTLSINEEWLTNFVQNLLIPLIP